MIALRQRPDPPLGREGHQLAATVTGTPRVIWIGAIVLLSVAVVLGGGGSPAAGFELLVELAAILVLVVVLWSNPPRPATDWWITAPLLALALFPVLQLLPLPPGLWELLPGRTTSVATVEAVGAADGWRPLSIVPSLTLASALAFIPPAGLFVLTMWSDVAARQRLIYALGALVLLSVGVGMVQVAAGETGLLRLYDQELPRILNGFQANRNSQADVLAIGLIVLAGIASMVSLRRRTYAAFLSVAALVFVVGMLATQSRSGVALLGVCAVAAVVALQGRVLGFLRRRGPRPAALIAGALGLLVAGGVLVIAVKDNPVIRQVFVRLSEAESGRPELWTDTRFVIDQYWPTGAGVGTFVPAFLAGERLDQVDPSAPNRAHNDYLEFVLEAGLPGLLILVWLVVAAGLRLLRRVRAVPGPEERAQLIVAGGIFAVVALHSLVDYPLRSISIASIMALGAGLLTRMPLLDSNLAGAESN